MSFTELELSFTSELKLNALHMDESYISHGLASKLYKVLSKAGIPANFTLTIKIATCHGIV